jgi:ornithine carbamoyltransferase
MHKGGFMKKKDFISIRDYETGEIRELLSEAFAIKARPEEYTGVLKGKALAMIFEKPSLRTRVTFDVGIHQLGGFSILLTPAEINLGKRESVFDVAKNLERMVQGIMIRTFAHATVVEMAKAAHIPVINALSDHSHPCQAMADYMTMLEKKEDLHGLKLAFVGDGNNVAHSLIYGAVRLGVHIAVGTPPGYEPSSEVVAWANEHAPATGATIEITNDPVAAVSGADVVYTDVWASMGQESEADKRRKIFMPFQVNSTLFCQAKQDAIFMHCLPAHRGEEVASEVIDSPNSVVFQQAENRLHAQKAIMIALMG